MASITATKEKNLFDVVPEAREYYDFDKNKEIDISTLSVASHTMVWWKCPNCGDENCKTVNSKIKRLADGSFHFYGCKIHNNGKRNKSRTLQKVADTDFLARIWDSANNPNLNPSEIAINSKARANWVCPKCKHEWCASIYRVFDVSGRCPACEGRNVIVPGSTDVLSLVPEAKRYYNWEKNIDIDIEHLGVGSSTEVWWRCPDCGNETKMPIKNKVHKRRDGTYYVRSCNKCFGKWRDKPGKANKSQPKAAIVSENANLMKFWDWDGNKDLDPTSVHIYSRRVVAWKCPKCHYAWTSSVNNLRGSKGECPCCEQLKVIVEGINDIFTLVPEAKRYYDFEKNKDMDIASIRISSKRLVHWKCPSCGSEALSSCASKIKKISGVYHFCACKKCFRNTIGKPKKNAGNRLNDLGKNSLAVMYPDIALLWSDNNERSARTVAPNATFEALWVCPGCGLEHRALVQDMVNGNAPCPFCREIRIQSGYNTLADKFPDLTKYWSKNNIRTANDVFPTSSFFALWICQDCGGEYGSPVKDVVGGNTICPYCNNRRPLSGYNTLADKYPNIAAMWATDNDRDADSVLLDSIYEARWACPDCGGIFAAQVKDMVDGNVACPYCTDKRVLPGFNSLVDKFPTIAKMWSENNEQTANTILPSLAYNALWICPNCGGEYSAPIRDVVSGVTDCPYCTDKRVLPGFNSFAVKYPELLQGWDYLRNYPIDVNPDSISDKNQKLVWWKCSNGHKYRMSVQARILMDKRQKEACSICKGRRREISHFI